MVNNTLADPFMRAPKFSSSEILKERWNLKHGDTVHRVRVRAGGGVTNDYRTRSSETGQERS